MKYPKQIKQIDYMGKKCTFTHEFYRSYGNEKSIGNEEYGIRRTISVKWKKHNRKKASSGWIVGFGFCFNGTLVTEVGLGEDSKHFEHGKRLNYVKIRETPTGMEFKVPASSIKLIKENK